MSTIARTLATLIALVAVTFSLTTTASAHDEHDSKSASTAASLGGDLPAHRFETPRTVCVESRMGSGWTSPRAAAEELHDAIWYWTIVYRTGAGGCDGYDQKITIHRVDQPNSGRAWTNKVTQWKYDDWGTQYAAIVSANVYVNTNEKFNRTWANNRRTLIHELLHGMVAPRGPEWVGGHTTRCDSMLSDTYSCIHAQDHLTDFDKSAIQSVYWPAWQPTFGTR